MREREVMKKNLLNYCGLLGVVAFLSYTAAVVFSPLAYPGYDWMAQAKRDSENTGNLPAVFHKKSRADILVTMTMDDWMRLYEAYRAALVEDQEARRQS